MINKTKKDQMDFVNGIYDMQMTSLIKSRTKGNNVWYRFKNLDMLPKKEIDLYDAKKGIGIFVSRGWNGSFHDCMFMPFIIVYSTKKTAGMFGRINRTFANALQNIAYECDIESAEIEVWEHSRDCENQ